MSKPFKTLRGRTILLDLPKRKESSIQLSAKDEEAMMAEAVKLWNKLTVYAIGDKVEEGTYFYVIKAIYEGGIPIEKHGFVEVKY